MLIPESPYGSMRWECEIALQAIKRRNDEELADMTRRGKIRRISRGEFPQHGKYVLIFCGKFPWRSRDDDQGKYWRVAKFLRGISMAERSKMIFSGDPQEKRRAKEYRPEDEYLGNLVPYCFREFGPASYFGQDIDAWAELPIIHSAVDAAGEGNALDEESEASDPERFEWEGVGED